MALWHLIHWVNSDWQAAGEDLLCDRNINGDEWWTWVLIIDLWCHMQQLSLYIMTAEATTFKTCCCQKDSPALKGEDGWRLSQNRFPLRESCFLVYTVVHSVTDLPKLAWQDPPIGAVDNGTEALSTNGTLTKCSDWRGRPIQIVCRPLLHFYSQ